MKNVPEVGKIYTDKDGFTVTVLAVERSGGGKSFGGNERKSKLRGHRVTIESKGHVQHMPGRVFEMRGFKCTSP